MKYRELGKRTGLRVSEIGLGAWGLGGAVDVLPPTGQGDRYPANYGDMSDDEAQALLEACFADGINFLDTAPFYGNGRSEERIGRAIRGRDDVIVATKAGVFIDEQGRSMREFSRQIVKQQFDESRRRLGRDILDIEFLHSPNHEEYGAGEAMNALQELKAEGKLRFIGVSVNLGPTNPHREFIERGEVDVIEMPLSLLHPEGTELLPLALQHGVGIVVRQALVGGVLSGRFTRDTVFPENDQRRLWPRERLFEWLDKFDRLSFLRQDGRRTPAQAALQWVLSQDGVSTVIAGAMSAPEMQENAAVPDLPALTPAELARVGEVQAGALPAVR